jgi:Fe2+ or Zn2+ uptake regulation protein
MACIHLQKLYDLCREHEIKLGGSDLIHLVCEQCGRQEVCPSMLVDHRDSDPEMTPAPAVELDESMRP